MSDIMQARRNNDRSAALQGCTALYCDGSARDAAHGIMLSALLGLLAWSGIVASLWRAL
jgi:hypothetical protein